MQTSVCVTCFDLLILMEQSKIEGQCSLASNWYKKMRVLFREILSFLEQLIFLISCSYSVLIVFFLKKDLNCTFPPMASKATCFQN